MWHLPLLVQCMQGNYTAGVDQMKFVSTEEGIKLLWTEGKETIEMPLHFSTPQSFGLAIGGEKWGKMASVATATSNEDDVPVLKILLCFLEHTAVRRMKFFFIPKKLPAHGGNSFFDGILVPNARNTTSRPDSGYFQGCWICSLSV